MNQPQKGESLYPCGKVSFRYIVLLFLGLTAFVLVYLSLSTSKLSVIVDMSIKMRGNVVEALNKIAEFSSEDSVNGTIYLKSLPGQENERLKKGLSAHSQFKDDRNTSVFTNSWEYNKTAKNNPHENISFNATNEKYEKITNKNDKVDKYGNYVSTGVNKRQSTCDSCFQHNFNYVIQNERICKLSQPGESIDLLILIFTTPTNIQARSALRETWLSFTRNNTANVRYAFLLGETKDPKNSETVLEENQLFHDIIKEDFIDTYANLTYKTIMGFKWAATQCSHAHYVMKTDDDMFVNVPYLLKILKGPNIEYLQSSITGACSTKANPIRDKKSKWFASVDSYPDSSYPGFCSGTGYVTSMHVVTSVYKISPSVPFFHLEDVYVSLCIKKLGFKLKGTSGFNTGQPKLDPCQYKGEKLITAHRLTPTMLTQVWNERCLRSLL